MPISRKEVEHVANLSRIELTEEEKEKFEHDLSAILDFVGKLNEVDTENVEPLTGGTILEHIMRKDEETDKSLEGKTAELLEAVPEKKNGWVKVKAIFG